MTVRELIEKLYRHDMDQLVYLINGNDLMWPTEIKDIRVMEHYVGTPPKLYDCGFPAMDNMIFPNAVLIHWK